MTLLPIIYTSLILFFGLLLLVTAISYLGFKARRKTNPLIEEEIIKQKNYLKLEKQRNSLKNSNNIVITQSIANSKSYQSSNQQYSNAQVLPLNYFSGGIQNNEQNNYTKGKNRFNNNDYYKDKKRETKTNYIVKPRITNSRIEILNGSSKFIPDRNEPPRERPIKRNIPDLSEYNLLNFYSDNPLNGFLNVTTIKSKAY